MFRYFHISCFSLILFLSISCNQEKHEQHEIKPEPVSAEEPVAGNIYSHVSISGISYSVYIPSSDNKKKKFPAIIFFDPHGNGIIPVTRYKNLAERFDFVLVGSNDSKNGMLIEQSAAIAEALRNEIVNTLPVISDEISIAGFSGGAKVALVTANKTQNFNAVIYCGAALPPSSIALQIPSLGFAGEKDMNFTDVVDFYISQNKKNVNHAIYEWTGKHEWPDTSSFAHAFYWSDFSSFKKHPEQKMFDLQQAFLIDIDKEIASEKNEIRKEFLLDEAISSSTDLKVKEQYIRELSILKNSAEYTKSKNLWNNTVENERHQKEKYATAFQNQDISWWKRNITLLNEKKDNAADQRILGYISLAAWTYSSKSIEANDNSLALKALEIYKLADPANSEQPFLKACLYSKNGNQDSAVVFLKDAIDLGLNDRTKIENEKNLFSLRQNQQFRDLILQLR